MSIMGCKWADLGKEDAANVPIPEMVQMFAFASSSVLHISLPTASCMCHDDIT